MKVIQGLFEKLVISVIFAAVVHCVSSIIPFISLLPQLSIYAGSKLIVDNKYTSFLLITVCTYLILTTILSSRLVWNRKVRKICPQFCFFSTIKVFSSNGYAKYEYKRHGKIDYLDVLLHNFPADQDDKYGFTTSSDCGIIFLKEIEYWPFSKGFKISNKKGISFEIMGKNGGEQIGLSFKNLHGNEQKMPLSLLMDGKIVENTWKKVNIELKNFGKVTHSIRDKVYIECFTFFTNSKLSKGEEVMFSLREIRFY